MSEFVRDFIKETLDAALRQFVTNPINSAVSDQKEKMLGDVMSPEYYKLYTKAKQYYGAYKDAKDLWGYRNRVELLLVMGKDIAEYADKKQRESR